MFVKRGSRLSISDTRCELGLLQGKWKLTRRVDEREVHRRGDNWVGKSSEEIFNHIANSIDVGVIVNGCASCRTKSQQKYCS